MKRKYKLVGLRFLEVATYSSVDAYPAYKKILMRRLKALVDIPRYGVKAGDLGGYVSGPHILSHEGDCWIEKEGRAWGNVKVSGNAFIARRAVVSSDNKDTMLTITDNARVAGFADVRVLRDFANPAFTNLVIDEEVRIFDFARVTNSIRISGSAKIYDHASVENARYIGDDCRIHGGSYLMGENSVSGSSEILGHTTVAEGTIVTGKSRIGTADEYLTMPRNKIFNDVVIEAPVKGEENSFYDELCDYVDTMKAFKQGAPSHVPSDEDAIRTLDDITARIDSYQKDIVQLIKYPLMADVTDPLTSDMMLLFNKALLLRNSSGNNKEFSETVDALEKAFSAAESNALRIAGASLSSEDQNKIAAATVQLQIAMDDAATEYSRTRAFQRCLRQLEGVIFVSEEAAEEFRVNAALWPSIKAEKEN